MKTSKSVRDLELLNLRIKKETVQALLNMGYGHFGGALSITEALACLYGKYLNHDPNNPKDSSRDYLVLSKGHAGPSLYSTLAICGYFNKEWLYTINDNGTKLPSHADMNLTPGIDMTTGSLGQGISCAAGMAFGSNSMVYSIVGDGELQEGQCWEAIQFAAHHKLNNFVVFVDNNKRQLDGYLDEIQNPFDIKEKINAFGFQVIGVDGQNISQICAAIELAITSKNKPTAIILDTIKGQGLPTIESITANHHLRLNDKLKNQIQNDLDQITKRIEELS
ncbi:transketolase [Photobacterium damselae]